MSRSNLLSGLFLIFVSLSLLSCGDMSSSFRGAEQKGSPESRRLSGVESSTAVQQQKERYVEGELIVKFRKDKSSLSSVIHKATGAEVIRRFATFPDIEIVRLPAGVSVREGIKRYMSEQAVEYAEPNYIRKVSMVPNDTYFSQQWALLNTGQFNGTQGSDIKATYAWDINTGSRDVVIAILDTGMDYNHPDLIQNRWVNELETPDNGIDDDGNGKVDDRFGWDFTTCARFNPVTGICSTPKAQDKDPMDDNGHGTHVSGIIGASGNNGLAISGIMWNVKLMPLKILNGDGEGSIADEISAIDYAVMMKGRGINIVAINASFGGGAYSNAEYDAISRVNNAGILFVTAAGNGGEDGIGDNNDVTPSYPGNYNLSNIISVAATDQNDLLASFSNYGLNSVHVAAPGVHILSLMPQGLYYLSGTSMATPHVTGLVGLLYSQYPWFTPFQIKDTLTRYVDRLPSLSGKIRSGGRINAYKAISSLLSPDGLSARFSSDKISLGWKDNSSGEDGFRIERRIGNGSFAEIAIVATNSTAYDDPSINDGTSYSYRVRAYNDIAESSYSNEVMIVTPLKAPSNLIVTATTGEATLTWTDNSGAEDGFRIERKGSDGNFVLIATVGPDITTYTDTGLQPSTTYTYRVKAFNSVAGESSAVEASVTTLSQGSRSSGSSGGGGCSVIAKRGSSGIDLSLIALIAFAFYALLRAEGEKRD
jgi:subtilisin family serine protease